MAEGEPRQQHRTGLDTAPSIRVVARPFLLFSLTYLGSYYGSTY